LSESSGSSGGVGSAIGAFFFVVAVLVIFAIGFDFFLIVPFFIFIIGIIAMMISDRKRSSDSAPRQTASEPETRTGDPAP
jgi:ABC-type bacteriocin/lantibiotic exporter with double-glycine peptidase domain